MHGDHAAAHEHRYLSDDVSLQSRPWKRWRRRGDPSFTMSTSRAKKARTKPFSLPKAIANEAGGGAGRDRTDDLMLAKHALYQLSYGPVW